MMFYTSLFLGPGTAHCDVPYTKRITTTKPIVKVTIYISAKKCAIDAVQLTSQHHHVHCRKCHKLKVSYNVVRKPSFMESNYKHSSIPRFVDK